MNINILDFQNDLIAKSKTATIPGLEWQDIVQELNLHLLQIRNKYKPEKSSARTFVSRVANNKIIDLARKANAKKRNYKEIISLDELYEKGFDVAYNQYGQREIFQDN